MRLFTIKPVYAHCDLPCGVYDPAQAMIEAKSVFAIQQKYDSLDDHGKARAIIIKEERAELVKHHLLVLWADYFKPEHLQLLPDLHTMFWNAIKQASEAKHSLDPQTGTELIRQVQTISDAFWETKKS